MIAFLAEVRVGGDDLPTVSVTVDTGYYSQGMVLRVTAASGPLAVLPISSDHARALARALEGAALVLDGAP